MHISCSHHFYAFRNISLVISGGAFLPLSRHVVLEDDLRLLGEDTGSASGLSEHCDRWPWGLFQVHACDTGWDNETPT